MKDFSIAIVEVDDEIKEITYKYHRIQDFDLNKVRPLEGEAGIVSELAVNCR